jgi:hypothetical protein
VNFSTSKPLIDEKMFGGAREALTRWSEDFYSVVADYIQQVLTNIGQFVVLRRVLKYLSIRMKCASHIVRNLSKRTGQKSAKFAKGRKSGNYA